MKAIHISPKKNFDSIMENGILRSSPLLTQYNDIMKKQHGKNYDKNIGLVFCFPCDIDRRDKYTQDFGYWKCWGDPRNRKTNNYTWKQWTLANDIGCKFFDDLKISSEIFSVFEVEVEYETFFEQYVHVQNREMNPIWSNMQHEFEHRNKPLVLLNYNISPECIREIGTMDVYFDKQNNIKTRLRI
jgi:hypothetical protein